MGRRAYCGTSFVLRGFGRGLPLPAPQVIRTRPLGRPVEDRPEYRPPRPAHLGLGEPARLRRLGAGAQGPVVPVRPQALSVRPMRALLTAVLAAALLVG